MVKLIESNNSIAERVMDMLIEENDEDIFEYSISSDIPNVILCKVDTFNIILSMDCDNPEKSNISYGEIFSADYSDPDNFFDKVRRLDDISSALWHVWLNFSSFLDNVKEGDY